MPKKINSEQPAISYSDRKTILERIVEIRTERGLTEIELAENIGINRDLIVSYERGRVRIY